MGRMLGAFDGDNELDRPDLNKCPDCGCYFAQETCPLCGKICPEEFRAGNRKTVRTPRWKKNKSGYAARNVIFVEWYHRWWFILLMMSLMPLIGIILLATSPHKRSIKISLIIVGILYGIVSTYGIGNIIRWAKYRFEEPVNTSLSAAEYVERCEEVDPLTFYRNAKTYDDEYVTMTLKVLYSVRDYDAERFGGKDTTYYVCTAESSTAILTILVRDCQSDGPHLMFGDVFTLYGEGAGICDIWGSDGESYRFPCVYMAYATVQTT